ncbi:MAG: PQQ-binding-like beta-propeller repeat protein [Acidobacteriota bacterium]|nr:PQQ-binding-like beta-propeller repeat protein [Acidobacteriota bacterium]
MKWSYPTDFTTNLRPATDVDRIYLPLTYGLVVSLNASDGRLIWKTDLGGELSSSPAADEFGVYIASQTVGDQKTNVYAKGALRALGREGGITLWMRTLPMPIRGTLIANEANLYGGSSDGRVYAIKKRTGDIVWTMQHSAAFDSRPSIFGSRLYIGSEDGYLFSLDKITGKIIWRYRTRGPVRGGVVVSNDLVYFGSADGYIYAVRLGDGRLRWRRRTGAGVETVAEGPDGLLVASFDNFAYSLSYSNGDSLWKRQLAGRVVTEPFVASDGVLFTPLSSQAGVVLDLKSGKQLNSLPIGENNELTASAVSAGKLLFLTTTHGLLAFAHPN